MCFLWYLTFKQQEHFTILLEIKPPWNNEISQVGEQRNIISAKFNPLKVMLGCTDLCVGLIVSINDYLENDVR